MGWFSQNKGRQAEQNAKHWLNQHGIQILAENHRCKGGEIDLIGLDTDNTLIFIEVKARQNRNYGHATEFVDARKQQRIRRCAEAFLLQHSDYQNHAMRFDVLAFHDNTSDAPEWLQNAF
ncbi:hypothetical protein AVO42_11660 [Thiomicrospira sp. XS5]|uniref:YraN family protein n=1 Tax=Thiomicrospira sp. XS5 TaxID=1775636 RepID=UPI00074A1C91|nr:YraN family protein [Thiomicrospira sp. XS5]KUJ75922.1 hypothetical protein AVO42_11660 [Thiomicrospira sp. XS5]